MKQKKWHLRLLGRALKFFVIGSFVATRTASGSADPAEEALRHELAWMSVRDGLSDTSRGHDLTGEIRKLVEQEFDQDLDFRVGYTYRAVSPDEIARLDSLWMDQLVESGVGSDEIDRFLGARTVALRQMLRDEPDPIDDPEQRRNLIREFSRSGYTG